MHRPRVASVAALSLLVAATCPPRGDAACNAIPGPRSGFVSALGSVSTPFATPDAAVVIRRDAPTFPRNPARNPVTLTFTPSNAPALTLANATFARGIDCPAPDPVPCMIDVCVCAEIIFPDTAGAIEGLPDGQGMTGPVRIDVVTDGALSARIATLLARDSTEPDPMFPSFVALPPFNSFGALERAEGDVLAASDGSGSVLIPLDVSAFAPPVSRLLPPFVPIVEAEIPGLQELQPDDLRSFSADGRQLSVSALPVGSSDHVLGTLDGPTVVLRIAGGLTRLPVAQGMGPLVIPRVKGYADDRKQAVGTFVFTKTRAVYEAVPDQAVPERRELRTFDLATRRAEPMSLHAIDLRERGLTWPPPDCKDFASAQLPLGLRPFEAYRIYASDSLVGYVVPKCFRFDKYVPDEIEWSGAYDLVKGVEVLPKNQSRLRPLLVADDVLVYSTKGKKSEQLFVHLAGGGEDELLRPPRSASCPERQACRASSYPAPNTGDVEDIWNVDSREGQIAYVRDEQVSGKDLSGNGSTENLALFLYDSTRKRTKNLALEVVRPGNLVLTGKWLAVEVPTRQGRSQAVAVIDVTKPGRDPRLICDDGPGPGYLASSRSDSIVACAVASTPHLNPTTDPRWSPTFRGRYLLRVFLPGEDFRFGREIHLGLALASPYDVQTRDATLVAGVDERAQCADVNGDGRIERSRKGRGPYAVYVFDASSGRLTQTGADVVVPRRPLLALERNFAAETLLAVVTGTDTAGAVGETFFISPVVAPEDAGEACTVYACANGACEFRSLGGVAGVDCALGRLLAEPLCGELDPLPAQLESSIRQYVAKAVAELPGRLCPRAGAQSWRRIKSRLALVRKGVGHASDVLSNECATRLEGLVEDAFKALDRARHP